MNVAGAESRKSTFCYPLPRAPFNPWSTKKEQLAWKNYTPKNFSVAQYRVTYTLDSKGKKVAHIIIKGVHAYTQCSGVDFWIRKLYFECLVHTNQESGSCVLPLVDLDLHNPHYNPSLFLGFSAAIAIEMLNVILEKPQAVAVPSARMRRRRRHLRQNIFLSVVTFIQRRWSVRVRLLAAYLRREKMVGGVVVVHVVIMKLVSDIVWEKQSFLLRR